MKAIGLMSGTSLDGVDVALIDTDGEAIASFGPVGYRAYSPAERAILREALDMAVDIKDRHARPGIVADAEALVTRAHAEAVDEFISRNALRRGDVDIVGFHGQTVLHRPAEHLTVQIGDGAMLARTLKLPVVSDFRAADVAAGGEGAPFVPAYHKALALRSRCDFPVAILNIGGVANMTYIDGETLIACDTGPGNALLDDFMLRQTGDAVDRDGTRAAKGTPDRDWVARALKHPFFALRPPKSLDRNDFVAFSIDGLSTEDGAATLTAFTAASIAQIVPLLPQPPRSWIVVGGGANNPTLLKMLSDELAPATLVTGNALGWSGDAIEAQAFAYLAVRSLNKLPLTYPGTTGVKMPLTGGVLAGP